ncbi:MAG TPA: hypothetical protein VGJ15_06975, partial [Pirellulales bacterium]
RRASGGGAILHDQELTYSIALPTSFPLAARAEDLYFAFHRSLIETLAEFGVVAALCELPQTHAIGTYEIGAHPIGNHAIGQVEPFLCFQRRTNGDVLLGAHKIAGSAQRRWRGAVLQHGSVLLARSESAPELVGISDLIENFTGNAQRLWQAWLPRIQRQLRVEFDPAPATISPALAETAREIAAAKFANSAWTFRK